MALTFQKASKRAARLRMALIGPAGSGKTYTGLRVAASLGKRVAVIDTERGSASKYADLFDFDTLELESFGPETYVEAINTAEAEGYDVLIIDSLSHAWMGKDGALEQVDNAARRSKSGNKFTAWRDVTPKHNRLVDAMIGAKCHVIATMRSKTAYEIVEDEKGKKKPVKIGLAPIQRDGLEYEFDVVGDIDLDGTLVVAKTRCSALRDKAIHHAGEDLAAALTEWLSDGESETEARKLADDFIRQIERMSSLDDLAKLAGKIKAARLPAAHRDRVRAAYKAQQQALTDRASEPEREPGDDSDEVAA